VFRQPAEQTLVTDVESQSHLWLLAVATERALADQQANHHAAFELAQRWRARRGELVSWGARIIHAAVVSDSPACFTV
jgi:hypothetical protein